MKREIENYTSMLVSGGHFIRLRKLRILKIEIDPNLPKRVEILVASLSCSALRHEFEPP